MALFIQTCVVYANTIIHLGVDEWWWIFTSPIRGSANIHHDSSPPQGIIVNYCLINDAHYGCGGEKEMADVTGNIEFGGGSGVMKTNLIEKTNKEYSAVERSEQIILRFPLRNNEYKSARLPN